jgi:hypothetical protein
VEDSLKEVGQVLDHVAETRERERLDF